jgi:hypothetical protein
MSTAGMGEGHGRGGVGRFGSGQFAPDRVAEDEFQEQEDQAWDGEPAEDFVVALVLLHLGLGFSSWSISS